MIALSALAKAPTIRNEQIECAPSRLRVRRPRALLVPAASVILALLSAPPSFAQQRAPNEYQVKAAFLFNFAKFVEWPDSSFASASSTFKFCVLGQDPFGKDLDNALLGKKIAEHPVELIRTRKIQELDRCQVVFVNASESAHVSELVASLRGRNVLLVGEAEEFAGSGGTIQFFLQDNRVRFVINPDAASRAGLKLSSKLLALATVVRDVHAGGLN